MHKIILHVGSDSKFEEFMNLQNKWSDETVEQAMFLKKKMDQILENNQKKSKELWEDFTKYLKERKILPEEYDPEKHSLSFDKENGILWCKDKGFDGQDLLRMLLGKLQ